MVDESAQGGDHVVVGEATEFDLPGEHVGPDGVTRTLDKLARVGREPDSARCVHRPRNRLGQAAADYLPGESDAAREAAMASRSAAQIPNQVAAVADVLEFEHKVHRRP